MTQALYPGFDGTVAVVTGGAKGIGEACVRTLVEQQAKVAIFDADSQAGTALVKELGGATRFYQLDVSDSAAVRGAFADVASDLGPPTKLVNNAGIQHHGTAANTSDEDWDRVLNVNLKSAFLCAREAIPHMQRNNGGVIVNVASVQAFLSQNCVCPYTTSKTALLGLTRSIAVDFAPAIRCVAVCPGTVDTPMLVEAVNECPDPDAVLQECHDMHPLQRIAKPSEVAGLIVYLLSDLAGFITGQAYRIDGGLGLCIGGSKQE